MKPIFRVNRKCCGAALGRGVYGFLILVVILNAGYYKHVEEHGSAPIIFLEKTLALQIKFVNPYASGCIMRWMASNKNLLIIISVGLGLSSSGYYF